MSASVPPDRSISSSSGSARRLQLARRFTDESVGFEELLQASNADDESTRPRRVWPDRHFQHAASHVSGPAMLVQHETTAMNRHLFHACCDLVERLLQHEHAWIFSEPSDEILTIGTVYRKLLQRDYLTVQDFGRHVRLVFDTAMKFNSQETFAYVVAQVLMGQFNLEYWHLMAAASRGSTTHSNHVRFSTPHQRLVEHVPTAFALNRRDHLTKNDLKELQQKAPELLLELVEHRISPVDVVRLLDSRGGLLYAPAVQGLLQRAYGGRSADYHNEDGNAHTSRNYYGETARFDEDPGHLGRKRSRSSWEHMERPMTGSTDGMVYARTTPVAFGLSRHDNTAYGVDVSSRRRSAQLEFCLYRERRTDGSFDEECGAASSARMPQSPAHAIPVLATYSVMPTRRSEPLPIDCSPESLVAPRKSRKQSTKCGISANMPYSSVASPSFVHASAADYGACMSRNRQNISFADASCHRERVIGALLVSKNYSDSVNSEKTNRICRNHRN